MKNINVLLNGNGEVIGAGSQENVLRFQGQLLEVNKDEKYTIEEREFNGWMDGLTYANIILKEHNGMLYPIGNINYAESRKNSKLSELGNLYNGITELKKEMSDIEKEHCDKILSFIDNKYKIISEEDIEVKMF